ncbi:hypothetical protein AB0C59_07535 [Streptomyces sp. NPDC048664]|uniref:SCO2400 family protein n=1 Tax=Streptomyces sp. NPDC048664 TaxID=3154505 RepID=UPI003419C0F0
MDYCLPCRRHLNGALACPGCGTPVEEIRGPAPVDVDVDTDAVADDLDDREAREDRPGSRSARRNRKAAAHRRRRRRVLFAGAGLLLAAGALSLAELGVEAPGITPRAAADGGEVVDASTPSPTRPTDVARVLAATPKASSSAGKKKAKDDRKDTSTPTPSAATSTPPRSDPPHTPSATTRPPSAPPPSSPSTAPPSHPHPSPTRTCQRFLWWCT